MDGVFGIQTDQRGQYLGIDLEQGRGHGGELQALLHDLRRDEEGRRNRFLALTLFTQGLKRAELVERMQRDAHDVFGEGILLGDATFAHHAGDRLVLRHPLALHQQFEREHAAVLHVDHRARLGHRQLAACQRVELGRAVLLRKPAFLAVLLVFLPLMGALMGGFMNQIAARISGMDAYNALCAEAENDFEGFWARLARGRSLAPHGAPASAPR